MNMKRFTFLGVLLALSLAAFANGGYSIKIKLKGYTEKQLFLGYHFGDKPYLKDTAEVNAQGFFVFEGKEELPGGVYLVVMPPNNEYFQIVINKGEQNFTVTADPKDPVKETKIEGSPDNKLLYDYLKYLADKRPLADTMRARLDRLKDNPQEVERITKELEKLNNEVEEYQKALVAKYPKTLTAAIIKANLPLNVPEYEGTEEEQQMKKWRYSLEHFFDNIDLADPRMLRTPFLFERIDYFIQKMNVQHPDSLARAVDYVLKKVKPNEETFKFYLIHFLNFYAKSNIVGMDAVYVHLVDNYYAKGMAPWTDSTQLKNIIENSNDLKPTLIGKTAPNIQLESRDGKKFKVHDIQADYTIVYFWAYDCGFCKKATPVMKEFYEKFKDKNVKIVAVCRKFGKDVPECWKYVDENGTQDWIHASDPYNYAKVYYVKTTPQVFILDKNKEIISKRIAPEQLNEVMDRIIEMNKKDK
ncbi:MAG: redoxin domain-containing protein [Saprospiraceae bacterium]